jgi:hypothetical protein
VSRTAFSLTNVLLAGGVFGAWAKGTQLRLFCAALPEIYPHGYWLAAVTLTLLAFLVFWLAWGVAVRRLFSPSELGLWMCVHSLTYWILASCAFGHSFASCLRLFLAASVILPALLGILSRSSPDAERWRGHLLALLLIIAAQTATNGIVSPFSWNEPISAVAKNESIQLGFNTPLYPENFIGAKAFDLSGFTHAYWGSAPAAPLASFSYGTAFLTWLLDPPLIDVTAFFRTVQTLLFFWCVLGSFGFYLFCLKAMRLSYAAALCGGLLLLPVNPFFAMLLKDYFPTFVGVLLTLPWAMLLFSLALERRSRCAAFAAGLTFCLNFYILPSHPEVLIHGLALLLAYAAFFSLLGQWQVFTALLLGLAGGVCAYAFPVLAALRHHDLAVFGHLDQAFRPSPAVLACLPLIYLAVEGRRFVVDKFREGHFRFFMGTSAVLVLCLASLAVPREPALIHSGTMFLAVRSIRLKALLVFCLLSAGLQGLEELLILSRGKYALAGTAACAAITALIVGAGRLNYFGAARIQKPYLLLRTMTTNYSSLRWPDPASLRLLQDRLSASGAAMPPPDKILEAAQRLQDKIDDQNAPSGAGHPLLTNAFTPVDNAYVYKPDFNLPSVLAGLQGPFKRVLAATPNDNAHVGAVSGPFFFHDASAAIDSRFMLVYPMIEALYLLPGEHFKHVGYYDAPNPWTLTMGMVIPAPARKMFNIAGIDAYLFGRYEFDGLSDKAQLKQLPYRIPGALDPHLALVADERSYGMAYLAADVRYVPPFAPPGRFGPPFDPAKPEVFEDYVKETDSLQAQLLSLPRLHSILLEDAKLSGQEAHDQGSANRMTIENIAGNKAAFNAHCQVSPCVLVFNTAAVEGWTAFSDRTPLEIKRANYAFLGVDVPLGDHVVWFEYRPISRLIGAVASLISYLAGLVGLLLF